MQLFSAFSCPSCRNQALGAFQKLIPGFGWRYRCRNCGASLTIGFFGRLLSLAPILLVLGWLYGTEPGREVLRSSQQAPYLLGAFFLCILVFLFLVPLQRTGD